MLHLFQKLMAAWPKEVPKRSGEYQIGWLRIWELRQVVRLEAANFPEPLRMMALLRVYLMHMTKYIAVRSGRKLVAYIGFQMYGPAAHTISMCIHPDYRRQGLGKLVQKTADQVAIKLGARWFTGEVRVSNEAQLNMLAELGWETLGTSPKFFANGEDGIVVWNWLHMSDHTGG